MADEAKHILVVENNASLGGMIRKSLEGKGYTVSAVEDGRSAWEVIDSSNVDAVVTDYEMRDSVGTEVCRGLRQQKKYADVVLIVTATAGQLDLKKLTSELNLAGAFKKPFSVKELVGTLDASFNPAEAAPEPEATPEPEAAPEPVAEETPAPEAAPEAAGEPAAEEPPAAEPDPPADPPAS